MCETSVRVEGGARSKLLYRVEEESALVHELLVCGSAKAERHQRRRDIEIQKEAWKGDRPSLSL